MMHIRKFVNWEVPPLETHKENPKYRIMEKLSTGEKLTSEEKEKIQRETEGEGTVRILGYEYDFRPYMRKFIVTVYDQMKTVYAFNRTLAKKYVYGPVRVLTETDNEYRIMFGRTDKCDKKTIKSVYDTLQGLFNETPEKFTKKYHDSTLDYQRLEIKLNKKYTLKLQVH